MTHTNNKKDARNFRLMGALWRNCNRIDASIDALARQIDELREDRNRLLKNASEGDWEVMQEELEISNADIDDLYDDPIKQDEWADMWSRYCRP